MVLLQNAFILQFDYLNMKTTSIILCMTLTAGLMIGSLSFDYQQQASAQMGMGKKNPNMMGMMNPNMMNKTGMMGMGMGNMMMNPNMMGMMNPGMMGMGNMMMFNGSWMNPMMMPSQNITGSIKLKPAIFNSIASQIKISLSDAAASAQNELGNNSRVVAGHLDFVGGYLVYTMCAIDPDMNIHRLIVDAGNGNVLSSSKLSWQNMMGMGNMMMNPGMMGMGNMMMNPGMMGMGNMMMNPGMMGMGNMMIENRIMQQSLNNFSTIKGNNTIDNKNSIYVSIVFGANSRTTNAYQPNPVYIKEGQTIIWTNNDNNIHTVTQRGYSSNSDGDTEIKEDDKIISIGFNSGVLIRGQSFTQLFDKEGKYDYYCTIHPWMIGQVIVSANSNSTAAADTNNNNKSSVSSLSSSM